MLTAGDAIGLSMPRFRRALVWVLGVVLIVSAILIVIPERAGAVVSSGSLAQLTGEANCIGEEVEASEGNTCGTLVHEGTHDVFQVQVSPDGRSAYSVAINGDLIEYARDPASGSLNVIGCVTAGTDECASGNVVQDAVEIAHPSAIAVSPDGENVYVTGTGKHAVVEFKRDAGTGLLTLLDAGKACVTEEATGECEVKDAKGLNEPYGLTVSPDGENVYVTAVHGEALAEFARDTSSEPEMHGVLEPLPDECIGGPTSGCPIETAIGMVEPIGVVVSPDGKNVYVASGAGSSKGAVVAFRREGGGALEQLPEEEGCVSESVADCKLATAMQGSEDLVVSPDGKNVYATSGPKNALVELKRNEATGALEQLGGENGCVTTETIVGCKEVTSVGLTRGVAISPRGEDVYVSSAAQNGVAAFARGNEGALTQLTGAAECVTSEAAGCSGSNNLLGLKEARRLAISPDGTNLYVAGQQAGAVVELARTVTPKVTSVNLAHGSLGGGETVRIKGFGFSEDLKGVKVLFGSEEATATISSGTTILATSPAHSEGVVHVTVENEAGLSTEALSDEFTYTDSPTVAGVSATAGSEEGGTEVTITGSELAGATAVRFGSSPASTFKVESPETIVATSPAGTGSVDVTVQTSKGTSGAGVADKFSYVRGSTSPQGGLVLEGYCQSLGYQKVTLEREGVGGPGFAYDNWACEAADGSETLIANTGAAPSMANACEQANPGVTVYGFASDPNSAFSWGCYKVVPPEESEGGGEEHKGEERGSTGGGGSGGSGGNESTAKIASTGPIVPPAIVVTPPELHKTGNVAPVSGTVSVELPGTSKFVPLATLEQVPFGSLIEATQGHVSVTVALPGGKTETGEFFAGEFILRQGPNGVLIAELTGGNFSVCPTARERAHKAGVAVSGDPRALTAAASGSHVVRKLWANAHGKFETKGNYAAGAVQGTEWLTEDRCNGTYIKVTRDKVAVTNLVNHRHVEVKKGRHYLAKAPRG
jgi:DNA-binding beta-propeller fold protein YncE